MRAHILLLPVVSRIVRRNSRKATLADSQFPTRRPIVTVLRPGEEGKKMSADISAGESEAKRKAGDLADRRLGVAVTLSLAMIAIYFGFMGLFAFNKPLLGTILAPGLSLCIILGPVVIVSSFLLCLVYVRWANRVYDPGVAALKR
jgi:uncharacterized membrane protein (DUF485 family)